MDLFDLEIPIRATGLANVDRDFHLLERAGEQAAARTEAAMGKLAPPQNVSEGFRRMAAATREASDASEVAEAKAIAAAEQAAQASQEQFDAIQKRTEALQQALRSTETESAALAKLEGAERQLAKAFQDGNLALSTRARINQELTRIEQVLVAHRAAPVSAGSPAAAREEAAAMQQVAASTASASAAAAKLLSAQQALPGQFQQIAKDVLAARQQFAAGAIQSDGLAAALSKARASLLALNEQVGGVPRGQAETFRLLLAETEVQATKTGSAFTALALDVQRATTAYKAGAIGLEAYQTAMATARAEALALAGNTANLSKGELTTFNTILRQTDQAAKTTAKQGLGTMRSALATMAVASLGARSSIGSLLSGLALFAGGSGIALGVIAGLAGIVAILDALTASGRQAAEQQRKLREELRKTTEERRRAADPSITRDEQLAVIEQQRALLKNSIAQEERGAPIVGAGGLIIGHEAPDLKEIQRLRGELEKLDADAATARQTFRQAQQDAADERIEHLAALVRAGTATVADQQALRDELTASKAGLAALGDEYRKTNDGIETAARLTQRITTIESAFSKAASATGTAQGGVAASLRDRTTALIALQALEGPTVERWQALTDRAAQLREELDSGNLTLDQRVARLRELQQIEQAQDFGVPDVEHIQQRGPDIRRTPPQPVAPVLSIPGGEGSLFGQMVQQIEAGGASAEEAVQQVNEKLTAAGEQLSEGVADALTSAFSGNTDFGAGMLKALGSMVIRFGVAVSHIGALMAKALKALSSLNPVAAIAAGAALVALGALLSSAAKSSFTPGGSGGANLQPISITTTLPSAGTATAPQAAGTNTSAAAVRPVTPVTVNQTIIGVNDPAAQRAVALMVQKAAGRGAG